MTVDDVPIAMFFQDSSVNEEDVLHLYDTAEFLKDSWADVGFLLEVCGQILSAQVRDCEPPVFRSQRAFEQLQVLASSSPVTECCYMCGREVNATRTVRFVGSSDHICSECLVVNAASGISVLGMMRGTDYVHCELQRVLRQKSLTSYTYRLPEATLDILMSILSGKLWTGDLDKGKAPLEINGVLAFQTVLTPSELTEFLSRWRSYCREGVTTTSLIKYEG
jgi:hypothetical protein